MNDWRRKQCQISVQFSRSVISNSLQPRGLQHARPPCPSPTPGIYSNSCPSSQWCHPTISFSFIPFSSRLQSFPASGSFQISQFFASGGQSIGVSASASVLPINIQDWFPLGCQIPIWLCAWLPITVRTECALHGPGRPDFCPVSGLTSLPLFSIHVPSAQGLSPGCIPHLGRAIALSLSAHPSFLSLNVASSEKPSWIHTWPWGLTLRYLCPSGT